MPRPQDPITSDPERILIIRPSALGDVCRSVPVLASLRRRFPAARIDWLVQDTFAPAIAAHPALTNVIRFPRAQLRLKHLLTPEGVEKLAGLLRQMRRPRYDVVFDCQGLLRSGFFAWSTRARRRVGYANAAELGWLGVNQRVPVPRQMHAVDRMLALVEATGTPAVRDMRLYTMLSDRMGVPAEILDQPYAVLAPTSRWPGKRWPPERFAEVATAILGSGFASRVVLVGSASEREQCQPLTELARREPRIVDLIGQTDVGRLMAVIERSALVVANDSAALHMAVGFERPLVALYGPTRTELVGPYHREQDVIHGAPLASNLSHKDEPTAAQAMASITASTVIDAVLSRLAGAVLHRHGSPAGVGRPASQEEPAQPPLVLIRDHGSGTSGGRPERPATGA